MSDTNPNPESKGGEQAPETKQTPKPTSKDESGGGFDAAFKSLQADKARLEGELAAMSKKLGDRDKELGDYKSKLDGYVKREREGALVAKVKEARPDLSDLDIRGRLAIFAEEGKVDRFSPEDKLEENAKSAIELIEKSTPKPAGNTRQPAKGGGPSGAPQQPRQPNPLRAAFGLK